MSDLPSRIELAGQVQENLIAYFRLFAGLPGVTFVEDDVTWLVSAGGAPGNHVLQTRIPDDASDRRITEVLDRIGQEVDQVDWLVFPDCRPTDLGARLAERGAAGGPGGIWMAGDLTGLPAASPAPAEWRVEYVNDYAMLETWKQASAEGFEMDVQIYYDAYARHSLAADAVSLHYIGYLGDTPVTSSTLLLAGGIAGIYDISTPPHLRRQGFGSAITFAMMQEAQKRGYTRVWIWSSTMGQNVYRRLGFVPVDFGVREYRWQKRPGEALP